MADSIVHRASFGRVKFALNLGGLAFTAPGLGFRAAAPGVEIFDQGRAGASTRLWPAGAPRVSVSERRLFGGSGQEFALTWNLQDRVELSWRVTFHAQLPCLLVNSFVKNLSGSALAIKELGLLDRPAKGASFRCDGSPAEWFPTTFAGEKQAGSLAEALPSANQQTIEMWKGFNMPIPYELPGDAYNTDGAWRCFCDVLTLYSAAGRQGVTFAAVGRPSAAVQFRCHVKNGAASLLAACQMGGVVLEPGQVREGQETAILPLPYEDALDLAMRWMAATHGARTQRPPVVGWCSWYDKCANITARDVLAVAETAVRLRERIPLDYIQIDDGFQKTVGDWDCHPLKFPDGWAAIIEKIRAAGSVPGIWLAPLAVHESTDVFKQHPEWFQHDAKGNLAGEANNWGPKSRWLDPTHPGAREFIRGIIRKCRAEGFEYFKIDFNSLNEETVLHDSSQTPFEALRGLYTLYREEMGEVSYLLSCTGFARWTVGLADGSRIGADSCAEWRAPHPCCISQTLKDAGRTAAANGILYANDPDVTYLRPRGPLTEEERRSWHSYVGLLGGFMMVSEALDHCSPADLRMLEILTPPAPEKGRSVAGGSDPDHKVLGLVSRRPWGNAITLTAYNPHGAAMDLEVDLALFGLPAERFAVWSFWDGVAWETAGDRLTLKALPPHGCKLLRLTPIAAGPAVIGSDLHISCGAAEIADLADAGGRLSLTLSDAGAREGALFIRHAGRLAPGAASGLAVDQVAEVAPGVWRVAVSGRRRGQPQHVVLAAVAP